jgi:hypothetical protein
MGYVSYLPLEVISRCPSVFLNSGNGSTTLRYDLFVYAYTFFTLRTPKATHDLPVASTWIMRTIMPSTDTRAYYAAQDSAAKYVCFAPCVSL